MTPHHEWPSRRPAVNVGPMERLLSLLFGGFVAARGLKRGTATGLAASIAGGYLVYRGVTGHCSLYESMGTSTAADRAIELDERITIGRPVAEVWGFWRNLENLPEFMRHLEEVKVIDQKRSHWAARGPGGIRIEWDAEITGEKENEYIAWKSLPFSDIESSGLVEFRVAPGRRGTEIRVRMSYGLPGGAVVSKAVATLIGTITFRQVRDELQGLKQMMETGGGGGRAMGE